MMEPFLPPWNGGIKWWFIKSFSAEAVAWIRRFYPPGWTGRVLKWFTAALLVYLLMFGIKKIMGR